MLAGLFLCTGFRAMAGEPDVIYIGQGDHYDMGPYYAWGSSDLWVNITVTRGGNVDVYVMNMNQYYNAYPADGGSGGIAFKNCSQENVSQASIHLHIEADKDPNTWDSEELWVIVDNRNVSVTPNDANAAGDVIVRLEVDWVDNGPGFYDDFLLGGILMVLCSVLPFILIIVLLFMIFRRLGKKNEAQPPMPYYYPYPPPVMPSPQETDSPAPAPGQVPVPPNPPMEQNREPEPPDAME